jgi:hypothetical protein
MIVKMMSKRKPNNPPGRSKKKGPDNGLSCGGEAWADAGVFDPEKKTYIPALQFFHLDEMHLAMSGKRLDPPERVLKPNGTTLEGRVNTTVRLTDIS